jgi:hypothetical protein
MKPETPAEEPNCSPLLGLLGSSSLALQASTKIAKFEPIALREQFLDLVFARID